MKRRSEPETQTETQTETKTKHYPSTEKRNPKNCKQPQAQPDEFQRAKIANRKHLTSLPPEILSELFQMASFAYPGL